MRNLLVIFLLVFVQSGYSQTLKTSPLSDTGPGGIPVCPSGTCPSAIITLESFNFHKPRTSCSSGFGLCIKMGFNFACLPCNGKSFIKDGKVNGWAKINEKAAELHIPVSLKTEKGFEKTDMSTFELEDKSISFKSDSGVEKTVRGGIYPVTVSGDEYIVNIQLY